MHLATTVDVYTGVTTAASTGGVCMAVSRDTRGRNVTGLAPLGKLFVNTFDKTFPGSII